MATGAVGGKDASAIDTTQLIFGAESRVNCSTGPLSLTRGVILMEAVDS